MNTHISKCFVAPLFILCGSWLNFSGAALAAPVSVPVTYKDAQGAVRSVTMTSPVSTSGAPIVENYRDGNGKWTPTLVTQQICGVDVQGKPQSCNNAILDSNGDIDYSINSPYVSATAPSLNSAGVSTPILSVGGTQNSYKLPGQNSDPWVNPHALWLGGQRSGAATSVTGVATDEYGSASAIELRGLMDGPDDLGCLFCISQTYQPVMNSRAPLSGNLTTPSAISQDPSFDTSVISVTGGSVTAGLVFENVTYDATHIYMPGCGPTATGTCVPLTAAQIARIHPNMYVTTNSIDPNISQHGYVTGPHLDVANFYAALTTGDASSDGKSISVYGWGILGGDDYNHPWSNMDFPGTTYDTRRSNYGHSEVAIGSPTGMEVENDFITLDPDNNPASQIRYSTLREADMHYAGGKDNEGTMMGIVLAYDCSGNAKPGDGSCHHPTMDSAAIQINGTNLPIGIENLLQGWGTEYMGYNFYIPGSNAPGTGTSPNFTPSAGLGNSHTAFESFTPTYNLTNQLVLRSWVTQNSTKTAPTWSDYSVNIGEVVDGTRWDASASTGTHMGLLSFNWNSTNLGGVCLIGNQNSNAAGINTADPGLCVHADGSTHVGYAATFDSDVAVNSYLNITGNLGVENGSSLIFSPYGGEQSASPYFAANAADTVFLATNGNGDTATFQVSKIRADTIKVKTTRGLTTIQAEAHDAGDRVFCADCLNAGQSSGKGTGRWIFLDTAKTWRSDDGVAAAN